jgi:hypothetical protein
VQQAEVTAKMGLRQNFGLDGIGSSLIRQKSPPSTLHETGAKRLFHGRAMKLKRNFLLLQFIRRSHTSEGAESVVIELLKAAEYNAIEFPVRAWLQPLRADEAPQGLQPRPYPTRYRHN